MCPYESRAAEVAMLISCGFTTNGCSKTGENPQTCARFNPFFIRSSVPTEQDDRMAKNEVSQSLLHQVFGSNLGGSIMPIKFREPSQSLLHQVFGSNAVSTNTCHT